MILTDNSARLNIREAIEFISRQDSQAIALLAADGGPCTYGHLGAQVDEVARYLRRDGIRRSDRVAVVLPNGPEMASAFLGIAACATCAPLNPSLRRDEFEFYLTDLATKAVVLPAGTDSAARDVAIKLRLKVIELAPATAALAGGFVFGEKAAEVDAPMDWGGVQDVALMLHTSGTTSRPKLVPLTHRNLCSSAWNIAQVLGLSSSDRCLNVMPLFHIHGLVGALLSSVMAGASVVCSRGFDSGDFAKLMRDYQPTWYSAVPTIHQSVLQLARTHPEIASDGPLRMIRSSSSALPPSLMADLEQTFRVPVIESYGMTEAAHQMASNPMPPADRKPGSVGPPAGPEMGIMNEDGHLLPMGEVGEIVIRGPSVTTGYVDNPRANETAFTSGWFRTGDLGRVDSDGYVYITGRKKEMINRGGENISPREVDDVLLEHPAVAQVVTFAVPHPSLGEDLAAAVVRQDEEELSEQELREFGFAHLADFKVPSQIVFVDAIPKGPTGKLQRIGLHEKVRDELRQEYVAPQTEMEELLVELWQEVLAVDQPGVRDNFFASGGDSLAAGRLVTRINSRFQLDLAVMTVFRAPSISGQAVLVELALLDQLEEE